jgi:hypothetical protein
MKTALLAILVLGFQIRCGGATPVAPDDKIYPLLAEHQASVEKKYKNGGRAVAQFGRWFHIESTAAARLFPTLRFASVRYHECPHPGAKKRALGLAFALPMTLAIDPENMKIATELFGNGDDESYGRLLVDHRIGIRNEQDAELVWHAFCDLHRRHWKKDHGLRRMSEREWRLGIYTYDQTIASTGGFRTIVTRSHYRKIAVDPDSGHVLSWKSIMDTSNRRRVAIPKHGGDPPNDG